MPSPSSVVLNDVSFAWPDGRHVLDRVSTAFGRTRTGLTGANGAGKSTLLKLMAGIIRPTAGTVAVAGTVEYLPQGVARGPHTVADLLRIAPIRDAIRAVESGSTDPALFETIGDDWDVDERATAMLDSLALPADFDRPASALSGGEAVLTAVAGVSLRRPDIALLDEPTNNLDIDSRTLLYGLVEKWRGTLIVVSHDVTMLDLMDATAELEHGDLTLFGGPYTEYRAWLDTQQRAARQSLRNAEQALARERRERAKTEERIAHSQRQGRIDRARRKYVPAAINDRRNSAEKSQGARRSAADAKIDAARRAVDDAELEIRDEGSIRIDLPDPSVPRGRRLATLDGAEGHGHVIVGPERIGLTGANGVGKTTLLHRTLASAFVPTGYLPQRIELPSDVTVLDHVRGAVPAVSPAEVRNRLARLLIRGSMVDRPCDSLSGGERFRVAFSRLVLAEPPPDLLVLDEPTNDIDIPSVDQLVDALSGWRGALVVVSHDSAFLARLKLDLVLRLDRDGHLLPAGTPVG